MRSYACRCLRRQSSSSTSLSRSSTHPLCACFSSSHSLPSFSCLSRECWAKVFSGDLKRAPLSRTLRHHHDRAADDAGCRGGARRLAYRRICVSFSLTVFGGSRARSSTTPSSSHNSCDTGTAKVSSCIFSPSLEYASPAVPKAWTYGMMSMRTTAAWRL